MGQGEAGTGGLNRQKPEAGTKKTLRCFVALQPDAAARERLDDLAAGQHRRFPQARRMMRDNLHLTLAFIGAFDAAAAGHLAKHLAARMVEPFDWTLAELGVFDRARVLWVGGADPRLDSLANGVRQLLDKLRIRYDRKPFVPHVTLLRKLPRTDARDAALAFEPPILWHVAAPVLLQSTTDRNGTRYTPLAATPASP